MAVPEKLSSLSHGDLLNIMRKAYRNGNWRRLKGVEKALFKASLQLARLRGRIVNPRLLESVKNIVEKLLQTPLTIILQLGREQASSLLRLYGENGVFKWAPDVKKWLKDPGYVLWLGVSQLALRSLGYA